MMDHARMKEDNAGDDFYAQAREKFLRAESLQPGLASYNLACLDSIRNDSEACRKHLQTALDRGHLPSIEDVRDDADLSNVNQADWFKQFVKTIPKYT